MSTGIYPRPFPLKNTPQSARTPAGGYDFGNAHNTVTLCNKFQTIFRDFKRAKFHLVDLAGSERAKKTQASGERLKEGEERFRHI